MKRDDFFNRLGIKDVDGLVFRIDSTDEFSEKPSFSMAYRIEGHKSVQIQYDELMDRLSISTVNLDTRRTESYDEHYTFASLKDIGKSIAEYTDLEPVKEYTQKIGDCTVSVTDYGISLSDSNNALICYIDNGDRSVEETLKLLNDYQLRTSANIRELVAFSHILKDSEIRDFGNVQILHYNRESGETKLDVTVPMGHGGNLIKMMIEDNAETLTSKAVRFLTTIAF